MFFYRVDVRETGDPDWHSLVRIRSKAALTLAGQTIAPAQTELETGVQVFPAKVNGAHRHGVLAAQLLHAVVRRRRSSSRTAAPRQLDASGALAKPGSYSDANIPANPAQKGDLYEPLLPEDCELKYGHEYEFRVRLGDLTGGGPLEGDDELNDAPATSASLVFRRYVAPKQLDRHARRSAGRRPTRARSSSSRAARSPSPGRASGYPALLFTELDTDDAFQKLLDDETFLHTAKPAGQTIKEYRDVSYLRSRRRPHAGGRGREDAAPRQPGVGLRSASPSSGCTRPLRSFDADLEEPFALQLEYRNANVIDFGNQIDLGDLQLSKDDIDDGDAIVLPRSRDIRITLYPVCPDKPGKLEYFGFAKTRIGEKLYRVGEPFEFFVREDADDEKHFFKPGLESHQLQGLYLQPDPPQVNNPLTIVASVVAGSELAQTTLMERIASQLRLDYKGQTLIGKPGERMQFGCSNRIRHTLAPDNSSLTFATAEELLGHWLCVLSFEVQRDWTWDGLADQGIEVRRVRGSSPARRRQSRTRSWATVAVPEEREPGGHDRSRPQLHARASSWTPWSRRRTR